MAFAAGSVRQRPGLDAPSTPMAVGCRGPVAHQSSRSLNVDPSGSTLRRLADGTLVRLRLLRPSDREKLLAGFERLSFESRYWRFFTPMPQLPECVLRRLLDIDDWDSLALVAEAGDGERDTAEGFGIARFNRLAQHSDTAEAAVAVVDHMQRRGLAALLLAALADAALERGIIRFRAEVLRTNEPVLTLMREYGGEFVAASSHNSAGVYEVSLEPGLRPLSAQAADVAQPGTATRI